MEKLCTASSFRLNSSLLIPHSKNTTWTIEENNQFESALAIFDEKTPNRWFEVAAMIPGKSVSDVMNQYKELVSDVSDIEAGLVPIPGYFASSFSLTLADYRGFDACRKRVRACDNERKKGVPWTEEEHRRFLSGLEKHGKGEWRNISRNFVITKTPTQVASHAQKYYLRQQSGGKDKKRPSIHDITTVNFSDNSPSNDNKNRHLDKSNTLESFLHKSSNPPKILMDGNDGTLMVFDSVYGDLLDHYPHKISTNTRIVNVGNFGLGFLHD